MSCLRSMSRHAGIYAADTILPTKDPSVGALIIRIGFFFGGGSL